MPEQLFTAEDLGKIISKIAALGFTMEQAAFLANLQISVLRCQAVLVTAGEALREALSDETEQATRPDSLCS